MKPSHEVALVGFPNSGKTTLFNRLTGLKQRVGNWPGVTVEKVYGPCVLNDSEQVNLVDLPGVHSLLVLDQSNQSLDVTISRQYIMAKQATLLVNVVDALALERDLYLTHELLELDLPMVIFISKTNLARERGIEIDCEALSALLGRAVFASDSLTDCEIKRILSQDEAATFSSYGFTLPESIQTHVNALQSNSSLSKGLALHALEGDQCIIQQYQLEFSPHIEIEGDPIDLAIADWRFGGVHQVVKQVLKQHAVLLKKNQSWIDSIALHRIFGIPFFLGVMYLLFAVSMGLGGLFQPLFDHFSETTVIHWPLYYLQQWHAPAFLMVLVSGVGSGINTTLTFIPVLFFMFFSLAFLEQSGYMVRAAVIIDRLMRKIGLSGKAFIPLIIGLGCNVPAVMATRTLENPRDRILTSLMAPFMSCGARLAIYAVFVSLFFQQQAHLVVFSLYLIGIAVAVFTGWLVRGSLLASSDRPLVLELPRYQLPRCRFLIGHAWSRVRLFLKRTARIIIPLCMLLTMLSHIDTHGHWLESDLSHSFLALIGQKLAILFYPMGIQADNWPAVIGLLSGMVAKEVVIGTLNTLYYVPDATQWLSPSLERLLVESWDILQQQLQVILSWILHPLSMAFHSGELRPEAGVALVQYFQTRAAAFAYLLFVLLYIPCFSTIAVIEKEISRFWAWFSVIWSTLIAYTLAVICYQFCYTVHHALPLAKLFLELCVLLGILIVGVRTYLSRMTYADLRL